MVIAGQGLWLSKCKGSWLSKQILLLLGLCRIWLRWLCHPTFLWTSAEQGITSEEGATCSNWCTRGRGDLFCSLYHQSSCHFLIHSKFLLVQAVALRILPIYKTSWQWTRGKTLEFSLPVANLRGIFLPFHLGNLGLLRSVLVWKMTGPKGLGSQCALCITQATPKPYQII